MEILVDTNVLARLAQPDHPMHQTALAAINRLEALGYRLCVVPQVIYELWAVCTRPAINNGLDMTVSQADNEIERVLSLFDLRRNELGIFARWKDLVVETESKGKTSHDARLVAAMSRHGIGELLTFNVQHFTRFTQIAVRSPESLTV